MNALSSCLAWQVYLSLLVEALSPIWPVSITHQIGTSQPPLNMSHCLLVEHWALGAYHSQIGRNC